MKKSNLLILVISLFIFPIVVNAASPKVESLDVTVKDSKIEYNGTMENGSYAVMCKLLDKDGKEVDLLSSAVDKNKFSGDFTVAKGGKYSVSCANYEGGKFLTKEVEVDETEKSYVVDGNEEAEDAELADKVNELIKKILNNEEVAGIDEDLKGKIIEAVNNGEEITVKLNVELANKDELDDAKAIEDMVDGKYTISSYYNISIEVLINNEVVGNITELDSALTLTLDVSDLDEVKEGYMRVFKIVLVHNDQTKMIDATYDKDTETVSGSSKLFSTYALVYQDVKNEISPKTGDNIVMYAAILLIAIVGLTFTVIYFKKKSN